MFSVDQPLANESLEETELLDFKVGVHRRPPAVPVAHDGIGSKGRHLFQYRVRGKLSSRGTYFARREVFCAGGPKGLELNGEAVTIPSWSVCDSISYVSKSISQSSSAGLEYMGDRRKDPIIPCCTFTLKIISFSILFSA